MKETPVFLSVFEKLGAVQKGHFILTSGNHSDTYVQCARILENPEVTAQLCKELVSPWLADGVDIVVGPAVGGIILSYELARSLKARALYTERADNKMSLRRGFIIPPGSKVIVAEDVITTGGSVKEVVDLVRQSGSQVLAVISLVDRRPEKDNLIFGVKYNFSVQVNPPIYSPDKCPLCQQGIPAEKPGSRGLK